MQEMNVDVAGEFLFMAAQLIYIKSRMLLPPDPDAVESEAKIREPNWFAGCWSTRNSRTPRRCSISAK